MIFPMILFFRSSSQVSLQFENHSLSTIFLLPLKTIIGNLLPPADPALLRIKLCRFSAATLTYKPSFSKAPICYLPLPCRSATSATQIHSTVGVKPWQSFTPPPLLELPRFWPEKHNRWILDGKTEVTKKPYIAREDDRGLAEMPKSPKNPSFSRKPTTIYHKDVMYTKPTS